MGLPIPVVVWVLEKAASSAAVYVGKGILQNAWAGYSEVRAFVALKGLFAEAARMRPDYCKPQDLNVACPALEFRTGAYNEEAGGSDTFNMYQFIRELEGYVVVMFYDLSDKIKVCEYTRDWKLYDSHVVLPSEALAEVKRVASNEVFA